MRGSSVYIFDSPPLTAGDWPEDHTENVDDKALAGVMEYKVREGKGQPWLMWNVQVFDAMFRVIKESENVDERQHCFLIQTFGQQSHYFSVETRQARIHFPASGDSFILIRSCSGWSPPGTRLCALQYHNWVLKHSTWFTRTDLLLSLWVSQVWLSHHFC